MNSPLSSMTGFANASVQTALGTLNCEMKTVNSRFLDLTLRTSDEVRFAEAKMRELIQSRIARGKMEVRLYLNQAEGGDAQIDEAALDRLLKLQLQIEKKVAGARTLSVSDILKFPGIVAAPAEDTEVFEKQILEVLSKALDNLVETRRREGEALSRVLLGYCDQIEGIANTIAPRLPEILQAMKDRLIERLNDALAQQLSEKSQLSREEINDRIRQEVTMYAMKMDVDEEINRLRTHVAECRRVLAKGGAVGRRLDFLMQELNRESNTLGSKAVAIEMTDASVNLKLVIEQMREQIQNLE